MSWSHIVIEGICFGDKDLKGNPCGRNVGIHCLDGGHCPYLGYSKSSERGAAYFAPMHLIVWDKFKGILESIYRKLRWWLWGKWHFDPNWIKQYPVGKCPAWDKTMKKADKRFPAWFERNLRSGKIVQVAAEDEVDLGGQFNRILLEAFHQVEKVRRDYPDDEHMNVSEDHYAGLLLAAVRRAGYIFVGKNQVTCPNCHGVSYVDEGEACPHCAFVKEVKNGYNL